MANEPSALSEADDFHQLKLLFIDPIQFDYEVVRGCVVKGESISARSRQTGLDRSTVGYKAHRFLEHGMLGLVDQRSTKSGRRRQTFPEPVAEHVLYLKQLYPPIHHREIARIVERKFGYHTNHHTVKRFLELYPIPFQLPLKLTLFHDFEKAYEARYAVVRMHYQGWNAQSIAGCLKLSERHVRRLIEEFKRDDFAGLEDQRTRPTQHPANQMTLPFLKEVLELQHEYPRAGRFRVWGLLGKKAKGKQPPSMTTVGRAMAVNREFHDAPQPWVSAKQPPAVDLVLKDLPYRPEYLHQFWFIDLRYLVQIDGKWSYSICILEGYSRQILVGTAAEHQDSVAVLQLLHAAVGLYGCPGGIVSDNGKVFTSNEYRAVLDALEVKPLYIEKGKPWQNLIEAQFKVQLRLADFKFERAGSLDGIETEHHNFIETFNTTPHWAHRQRRDGARTPAEVLGSMVGRRVDTGQLERIFKSVQFERTVSRFGFVSVQRFYIYAEHGLARKRVAVWVYEGQLRIEYEQALLARYRCVYEPRHKQMESVDRPRLYRTPFASPQLELWELDEEQWLKVRRRPTLVRRAHPRVWEAEQLALVGFGT